MTELKLSEHNFPKMCRLCLRHEEFTINVVEYNKLIHDKSRRPLEERIFDMFQVKIQQSDSLPKNICIECLHYTENYWEFRLEVSKCEERLQSYLPMKSKSQVPSENVHEPEEDSVVMVIDPTKDYDSTDESDSAQSDGENESMPLISAMSNETGDSLKNVIFCQYCDMAFITNTDCLNHEESDHNRMTPHSCNYCSFACASRNTIIAHIKECHDADKPYVCARCGKRFGRRSDLKKHCVVHTGIRPFHCPVCNKNFSRNTNLTKHLRIHSGLKPHVCQKCPRSFTTKGDLFRHEQVHSEVKPFQCMQCAASFSRKDKLQHHERTHLKREQLMQQQQILPGGTSMLNASAHFDPEDICIALDPFTGMEHHGDEQKQMNDMDDKKGYHVPDHISELAYRPHVTGDLKDPTDVTKSFACDICPRRFGTSSALQNHRNMHLGIRRHICTVCNRAFSRKRELDRHTVIHTGLKPYECNVCNKRFGRKDKLTRHERIHLEEGVFSCNQCHVKFSRHESLILHMGTHLSPELEIIPLDRDDNKIPTTNEGNNPMMMLS